MLHVASRRVHVTILVGYKTLAEQYRNSDHKTVVGYIIVSYDCRIPLVRLLHIYSMIFICTSHAHYHLTFPQRKFVHISNMIMISHIN